MLKTGKNWGKIANYPPQCSTEIGTPTKINEKETRSVFQIAQSLA